MCADDNFLLFLAVIMEAGDVLLMMATEKQINKAMKREKVLVDRSNPLENLLPDEVKGRFRFLPETIYDICKLIGDKLMRNTKRSASLPVLWQILIALRYFATGADYIVIADTFKISKSSVCRCVWSVAVTLANLTHQVIRLPNAQTMLEYKRSFFAIGGIPNITGAVDGCLIRIMRPTENTHEFICRKGWPAINIQVKDQL